MRVVSRGGEGRADEERGAGRLEDVPEQPNRLRVDDRERRRDAGRQRGNGLTAGGAVQKILQARAQERCLFARVVVHGVRGVQRRLYVAHQCEDAVLVGAVVEQPVPAGRLVRA